MLRDVTTVSACNSIRIDVDENDVDDCSQHIAQETRDVIDGPASKSLQHGVELLQQ